MQGTFYYICISRGQTILAEYTEDSGNFRNYMPDILPRLNPNRKEVLNTDDKKFFIESTDKFVFVVLTSKEYPQRVAFDALISIRELFYEKFSSEQRDNATEHSLEKYIKKELKEKYALYNSNKCDNILKLRHNMDELKGVVESDLQKLLNRGQNIEIIVKKSQNMKEVSTVLHKQAKSVKNHMWWQNKKITIAIIIAVILAIWLLSSFICGFNYSKC